MPPRRANRHRNGDAVYGREEADEMEQRINDNFNVRLNEGIGRLEKMMLEMNQNRRRGSPESIHHEERRLRHSERDERNDRGRVSVDSRRSDRDRGHDEGRDHRNVDNRSRDGGGYGQHRNMTGLDEEFERGSA